MRCEAGFTIIELLIAFTILAIVSGSLFQMFFVSTRNNAKAVDIDIANGLAITAAELFKADPYFNDTEMFKDVSGTFNGHTWRSASGDHLIKYYDSKWNEMEIFIPAAGLDVIEPEGASFILDAILNDDYEGSLEINYVSARVSLRLDATQNNRLVINENAGGIEVIFNGIASKIDSSHIGRVISINLEFNADGVLPKHVDVINRTRYMVNINVFGVPGFGLGAGGIAGAGTEYSGYIEVSPVSGSISVMYLDDQAHAADSLIRKIDVKVRALRQDGAILAGVEASKYIPG